MIVSALYSRHWHLHTRIIKFLTCFSQYFVPVSFSTANVLAILLADSPLLLRCTTSTRCSKLKKTFRFWAMIHEEKQITQTVTTKQKWCNEVSAEIMCWNIDMGKCHLYVMERMTHSSKWKLDHMTAKSDLSHTKHQRYESRTHALTIGKSHRLTALFITRSALVIWSEL